MIDSRVVVVGPETVAARYRAALADAGALVQVVTHAVVAERAGEPDAVVLVSEGSGEDLVDACKTLRKSRHSSHTRVVAVMPQTNGRLAIALFNAGAEACLDALVAPVVVVAQVRALVYAQRRADAALMESEERLRLAIDTTELGAFDFEPQSGRLVWSAFARRHFGLVADDEVTYETFLRGLHPDDRARMERTLAEVMRPDSNGEYATEYRTIGLDDGQERWLSARGRVFFDAAGQAVRFIGVTVDISARKEADEALRRANEELLEADRRKDEFIAILSHELRNPLAPIHFALPLIARAPLTPPAERSLAVIERQVGHLTRLVDDLLDVSRIAAGKLELRPERVALGSIVHAALDSAAGLLDAARHVLTVTMPEEPLWILADVTRLTQVVTNIVNNAAKCTARGGRISVRAGVDKGVAFLRVRDNGIGIPAGDIPKLFEMFRQVHRSNPPQGGLGIGLALSRRIVEMHGGTIDAFSQGEGQGAEFVIRIPVVSQAGAAGVRSLKPVAPAASTRRLKVLIVDDNEDLVEMIAILVTNLGHDVRRALDGASALAAAVAYVPDVVLLDLGLPIRSGIEVARELRSRPEVAAVRLIAITGWGQPDDRTRTRDAGFDEHLTKPVDPEKLAALLSDLSRSEPDSASRPH